MPDPSVDEYGIPIKKAVHPSSDVDEFGIPIKKKMVGAASSSGSPIPSIELNPLVSNNTPAYTPITDNALRQQQPQTAQTPGMNFSMPKQVKQARVQPQDIRLIAPKRKANSWENLGDFVPSTVLGGLEKDAGQAVRFIGGALENSHLTPTGSGMALADIGSKLEGWGKEKQQTAQEYGLPNTVGGHVVSSAVNFVPDLIELAATPELEVAQLGKLGDVLAKYGGKLAPKIASKAVNTAVGKFPLLMGAKGLTNGYSEAKDEGHDDYTAVGKGLVKSAEEYGKGVLFEGAGHLASKVSDVGKKVLEDKGWLSGNSIIGGAQKALLQSSAQATAFSAVPVITNALEGKSTSMDELRDNAVFGGVLGLFHGGEKGKEDITAADGSAKEIQERSPLVDLNNFMNADTGAIKVANDSKANAADLQAKAAQHADDAFKSDNDEHKQEQVVQASLMGKLASVKSVTDAVLKDKNAVIDGVNELQIPDEAKQQIIDKINEVHKNLDPIEQQKTELGNQIQDIDTQLSDINEKAKNGDAVSKAEAEIDTEELIKKRDEITEKLKKTISKQRKGDAVGESSQGSTETTEQPSQKVNEIPLPETPLPNESVNVPALDARPVEVDEPSTTNSETKADVQSEPAQQVSTDSNSEKAVETPVGGKGKENWVDKTFINKNEGENFAKETAAAKDKIEAKAGDPLRSFADKVRQGKISKLSGFKASTGFDAAWDGSLEVVATAIEGGAKVVDAIEAGLKHVKSTDWYNRLTNKDEFDKQYKEHLSNEYKEHEKTLPIKNEVNDTRAKEHDIELKDTKNGVRGNDVVDAEATAKIKEGYDTPDLVDKILNEDHKASDTEIAILSKYIDAKETEIKAHNERLAADGATMSKKQFSDLVDAKTQALNEFQDAAQAVRKTGTETARALNARKFTFNKEYSLENMITQKRTALGDEKLTPEQLSDITAKFEAIEKGQKELEKRIAKLTSENETLRKKEAEAAIKERSKLRIDRKADVKEQLAQERKKIAADLSVQLKKMRSGAMNDAAKASAEFIGIIAPYVKKMSANLIKEGVVELKDMVARIKDELDLKEVSDRDLIDIIAGKHNVKPVLDAETLKLRRANDELKRLFQIELAKDELKQRTKLEKAGSHVLNILSLPRALKASLDFSAVLRQGLFSSVGHPKEALTAFREMFRQTVSEERYKNWMADLKHTDNYELMQKSELYLSDKNDPKLLAREEEFTSNLGEKIPGIGKLIAASERAYTGYLNVLRAGVFESEVRELAKRGITFESNPDTYKGIAKVINILTGRGDIPEALGGKQPKILSNILFSPRFMAARIQTLYLWADPRLPREAKIMAAKDVGATLGIGATILSLAALAGYTVVTDPRSSNFLKIQDKQKNGTTYYDILGGIPQYVRFLSQLATQKTLPAHGGMIDLNKKRYGIPKHIAKFAWGKVSPMIGMGVNLLMKEDVVGQPYHLWPNVPQEFIPLPFSDVQDAYKVGGINGALKSFLPSQFGIGTSSYNPNAKSQKKNNY